MSQIFATLTNAFAGARRAGWLVLLPLGVIWLGASGVLHGVAMHYADQRLVALFYPLLAILLIWPLVSALRQSRAGRVLVGLPVIALFWWSHWLGWHLAEGAREQGPFRSPAWIGQPGLGDPYAFDLSQGQAFAMIFAETPPTEWPVYFHALSETASIDRRIRRRHHRGEPKPQYTAETVRLIWLGEPFLLWFSIWFMALDWRWPPWRR